jgi:hypothetical protein
MHSDPCVPNLLFQALVEFSERFIAGTFSNSYRGFARTACCFKYISTDSASRNSLSLCFQTFTFRFVFYKRIRRLMVLVTVVTSLMLRGCCGFSREIKNKFNKITHKTKENN